MWGHFQGGPLCLASSVCWSLQCLISALMQGGWWWTLFFFFLGSLVQLHCGEGGTLQTNNTGVCSQCLSHTWHAPAHSVHHSGSTLLHQEPSEAGPRLHAPPQSKPLRLGSQVALRGTDRFSWACVLCPSQDQVAQVFGECSCCDLPPFRSLLLSFLGVPLAPLVRQMVTIQDPKKS